MNLHTQTDAADVLSWLGAANTGLGIVLMAVFPLALPLLILTALVALPLVVLAIPVGLVMLLRRIRVSRPRAESQPLEVRESYGRASLTT